LSDPAPEHARYLAELGIANRPLTDSITPNRRKRPSGRGSKAIGVFSEGDLLKLRGMILWRFHSEETREGRTVVVRRGLSTVARINCATEALAWDAERICAGIRFRRGA
jgi:hypothetical protein